MGEKYNPQDGSFYTYELSRSITQHGKDMLQSFKGGKKKKQSKSKSRKKRYRYSKDATFHKKQYKNKSRKRNHK